MLCGGLSTALTDIALFPLDTIKIMQQSMTTRKSMVHTFTNIVKERGVGRLYSGAVGYSVVDGLGASLFFCTFETLKGFFAKHMVQPMLGASALFSASASFAVSSCLIVPAELIKTRSQTYMYPNQMACIWDILRGGGGGGGGMGARLNFRNMYTGYFATVFRDLPYYAINLGFYESIRSQLQKMTDDDPKFVYAIDLTAGATSGLLAAAMTTPMDVVAARLMCQSPHFTIINVADCPVVPYKGLVDCARRMLAEEGASSFLSGLTPRCLWMVPFSAISLSLYELLKRKIAQMKGLKMEKTTPPLLQGQVAVSRSKKSNIIPISITHLIQTRQKTRFF